MRGRWLVVWLAPLVILLVFLGTRDRHKPSPASGTERQAIRLPVPRQKGNISLEECLLIRRSVRSYTDAPLALAEASQLLWAAQGVTREGRRTAPSAGALYPLEVYLAAGNVAGLFPGVYRHVRDKHALVAVTAGDKRGDLASAALGQAWMREAPAMILITAFYKRTTAKYGDRGIRYVHMEAGHAAQNVFLQAAALGLGTVTVGAFRDDEVKRLAGLAGDETPLYLLPVGRP